MDTMRHVHALDRIKNPHARAAFIYLMAMFERSGMETSPNSGNVYAVRIHNRSGAYVFSYIANTHDLLFYLRRPAFEAHYGLKEAAVAAKFRFKENPKGELTLKVEDKTAAEALFLWLQARIKA